MMIMTDMTNRNVLPEPYLENQRLAKRRMTYESLAGAVAAGIAAGVVTHYFGIDIPIGAVGTSIVTASASYPVFRFLL